MKTFFGESVVSLTPKSELIKALIKGREITGKGEDDWETVDICKVIGILPDQYQSAWLGRDPVVFKNRMQRLRKDKEVPKVKPIKDRMKRLEKMARDFRRDQQRQAVQHSGEYINYIISEKWKNKAKQHKERCNWHCQLCGCYSSKLDCHHTSEGYKHIGNEQPWHLLAVCSSPCHAIADMMRQYGFEDGDALDLFNEDEIPAF